MENETFQMHDYHRLLHWAMRHLLSRNIPWARWSPRPQPRKLHEPGQLVRAFYFLPMSLTDHLQTPSSHFFLFGYYFSLFRSANHNKHILYSLVQFSQHAFQAIIFFALSVKHANTVQYALFYDCALPRQ